MFHAVNSNSLKGPMKNRGSKFFIHLMSLGLCLVFVTYKVEAQDASTKIEELIISASRLPRTIENIAGTVSVISAHDIEQELMDDLDDLSRFQPGISMETANRGGNQGFSIRGIGGNRVLTVIDGIRSNDIYAAGPSSYGKDSFEIDDLKSVEIIRGPASVLYGADAMGGAVLLHSKQPRDYVGQDTGSYFAVRSSAASADEQYKGGFTGALQRDSIGIIAQYTLRQFQEPDVNGDGSLNPQDGNSNAVLLKTYWDLSERQQVSFTIDKYREENETTLLSDLSNSVLTSFGKDQTDRSRIGFGYRWSGDAPLFDEVDAYLQQQKTDALQHTEQQLHSFSFLNPANPASYGGTLAYRITDFEFNQDTLAVGMNFRKEIPGDNLNHSIAYGLNYDRTETERPRNRCDTETSTSAMTCNIAAYPFAPTENFPNKTFPDSTTRRTGVYLQEEITLKAIGLTVIPGIRYDQYEMTPHIDPLLDSSGIIADFGGYLVDNVKESATSVSFGAIYDISDAFSVFLQYAEGYRPPNFDEANQAFVNLGYGYATVPNAELEAESSRGLEIGIRANLDNAFISAAVFDNHYQDFINSEFVGLENNISLFQDTNVGKARIKGAELLGAWYLSDQWQVRASLAYAHGDDEEAEAPLDSIDPLTAVIGVGYDNSSNRWGGELLLTLAGDKDRVSSDTVITADNYQLADLIAYYRWHDSHYFRAGIFNLFNTKYARWSSIKGLSATATTNIANAQQAGTNFRIGYSYEF